MDFDGLDDILEDNAYVPSFAPRQSIKNQSVRSRTSSAMPNKSISPEPAPVPVPVPVPAPVNNKSGGLFGLVKQTFKKEPTTFEDFFNKQKEPEKKMAGSNMEKNRSIPNFNFNNSEKQDDTDSIFSAQRTATRRPISKEREKDLEKQLDRLQPESPAPPRRGMMPPLNRKNQGNITSKQIGMKMDTNNSIQINGDLNMTKPVMPKYKDNDLDPLEALNKEESVQMKKFFENQLQFQKKSLQSMLEEERQSKKKEIESLRRTHEQELKKKLELKDYQIKKLKQFYEMQLSMKTSLTAQKKDISATGQKIDQNLKQLKKIQAKISEQYSTFQAKQNNQNALQLQRRESALERRQKQLNQIQRRLSDLEQDLKSQKSRIYQQQQRERTRIADLNSKSNQRQAELQSKYKKKQKELTEENEKKRSELDHQRQRMRYQIIEVQQRKMQVEEAERQLKKKMKAFEDKQKEIMEELHIQRTKNMEKEIEVSGKLSQLGMKENEIQIDRQQLTNKLKILELEKKKLEIESKGSIRTAFLSGGNQNTLDRTYQMSRNKDPKTFTTGSFDTYHKTISQMRDEMMKSLPKF